MTTSLAFVQIINLNLSKMAANEFKLNNCQSDGISRVNFSPSTSQFVLSSSWDMSVRLYDVTENTQRFRYDHQSAVLDCTFSVSFLLTSIKCVSILG